MKRLYEVKNGILYDTDTAETILDSPPIYGLLGSTPGYYWGKTPDGHYFHIYETNLFPRLMLPMYPACLLYTSPSPRDS